MKSQVRMNVDGVHRCRERRFAEIGMVGEQRIDGAQAIIRQIIIAALGIRLEADAR